MSIEELKSFYNVGDIVVTKTRFEIFVSVILEFKKNGIEFFILGHWSNSLKHNKVAISNPHFEFSSIGSTFIGHTMKIDDYLEKEEYILKQCNIERNKLET